MIRSTERTVGAARFEFELEPTGLRCVECSGEARWEPLCLVVPAEAFGGPQALIRRVLAKGGVVREGVHGFSFHREAREELAEGVTIDYFEDQIVVGERFFAEFVLATVSALEGAAGPARSSLRPTNEDAGAARFVRLRLNRAMGSTLSADRARS